MALRELLLPWDAQPQEVAPPAIDLGPDALLWSAAHPQLLIGAANRLATSEGSPLVRPGPLGMARAWSRNASAGALFGTFQHVTGLEVTAAVVAAPVASANRKIAWSQRTSGSNAAQFLLGFNIDGGISVSVLSGGIGLVSRNTSPGGGSVGASSQFDGLPHAWVLANGANEGYIYRDGVAQTVSPNARASGTVWTSAQATAIGNIGDYTTDGAFVSDDPIYLVIVWPRVLPADQAQRLSADLARNLGPAFEPRRIHVPVSAGGGAAADLATTGNSGTFSGTANSPATATLAATGASGALSASAGTSASAALAATGDSGTLSASAYTPALASLAATGGSGIFVGSAFSEATAALSATGGSGTLSASAGAEASASLAATGGSGTLAADAFVQAVATLAATGVSGSLIASAWTTISATLSATGGSGELTASAGEPVVATRVLSSYRPLPPPADPKDVGRWAMNEFLTIARHLADGRDFDLLNTIHAPPSKPREGMVVHADGTNWDPGSGAGRYERVGGAWVKLSGAAAGAEPEDIIVVCSDETTALTTGLAKATFRMPFDMTLQGVSASVTTAPTGAALIVDINDGASSVLSTKLSIDATEKTSATAATPAVISDTDLAEDAEITIDIDQVGSTIAGAGLKVRLRGVRA